MRGHLNMQHKADRTHVALPAYGMILSETILRGFLAEEVEMPWNTLNGFDPSEHVSFLSVRSTKPSLALVILLPKARQSRAC